MNFLEFQVDKIQKAGATLISPGSIFSLPQLAAALAIGFAFLAYHQLSRRGTMRVWVILRAMMSRRILFNRSTYADVIYFFINTFVIGALIGWGIFSAAAVSRMVVALSRANFGACAPSTAPDWILRTGITLVAFLGYEIGYYIDHYLKHKIPVLWEFHKTHHTAEVLTPLTVYRVHPVDSLIFVDLVAAVVGLAHGMFTYAVGKNVNIYIVDNVNVITVAYLFLFAQLQHSQFWIPLRGLPGRILLSPAHHQIHHSVDPAHYNRNLGSFLAIWDWMFGTLCVPQQESPRLEFGVSQAGTDPHRLQTLLVDPLVNALAVLRAGLKSARREPNNDGAMALR